jgi:hypothetical protein
MFLKTHLEMFLNMQTCLKVLTVCSLEGNVWRCVTVNWNDATVLGTGRRKILGGRRMKKRRIR